MSSTAGFILVRSRAPRASFWLTTWCLTASTASSATTETRRCAAMSLRWGWAAPCRSPTHTRAESEWPGLTLITDPDIFSHQGLRSAGGTTPVCPVSRLNTCWCVCPETELSWCGNATSTTPTPSPSGGTSEHAEGQSHYDNMSVCGFMFRLCSQGRGQDQTLPHPARGTTLHAGQLSRVWKSGRLGELLWKTSSVP